MDGSKKKKHVLQRDVPTNNTSDITNKRNSFRLAPSLSGGGHDSDRSCRRRARSTPKSSGVVSKTDKKVFTSLRYALMVRKSHIRSGVVAA